ncbi:hypothetical protein C1I98_19605 [Spongiactinospora gelatinilytica]|uniref:Uncharacterized protein n=2 Tax=Spongiactinospora gelatinilytica TaxID=2666298 RepID=A0A2W2G3B7_9ACTN|nr:hypothetical protein C1I98_19605 [Spongiactinospora gelatinilytica]
MAAGVPRVGLLAEVVLVACRSPVVRRAGRVARQVVRPVGRLLLPVAAAPVNRLLPILLIAY